MLLPLLITTLQTQTIWLEDLNLSKMTQDWGEPRKARSVDGHPLAMGGKSYEHGVGTHANSALTINLGGGAEQFSSDVGIDAETAKRGSVRFEVWVDGRKLADSGVMRGGDPPKHLQVQLRGARKLELIADE